MSSRIGAGWQLPSHLRGRRILGQSLWQVEGHWLRKHGGFWYILRTREMIEPADTLGRKTTLEQACSFLTEHLKECQCPRKVRLKS